MLMRLNEVGRLSCKFFALSQLLNSFLRQLDALSFDHLLHSLEFDIFLSDRLEVFSRLLKLGRIKLSHGPFKRLLYHLTNIALHRRELLAYFLFLFLVFFDICSFELQWPFGRDRLELRGRTHSSLRVNGLLKVIVDDCRVDRSLIHSNRGCAFEA